MSYSKKAIKVGTYVIGRDKSYERSIYRVDDILRVDGWEQEGLLLTFMYYDNYTATKRDRDKDRCIRNIKEFKKASINDGEITLEQIELFNKLSEEDKYQYNYEVREDRFLKEIENNG